MEFYRDCIESTPKVREHILDWDGVTASSTNNYKVLLYFFSQVKKSCFNTELHNWQIRDKTDIGQRLVLPLAGPGSYLWTRTRELRNIR